MSSIVKGKNAKRLTLNPELLNLIAQTERMPIFRANPCHFKGLYFLFDNKLRGLSRQFQNVQFCSKSRKAKILTTGIHVVFRGLKFEPDADIGQKGTF